MLVTGQNLVGRLVALANTADEFVLTADVLLEVIVRVTTRPIRVIEKFTFEIEYGPVIAVE